MNQHTQLFGPYYSETELRKAEDVLLELPEIIRVVAVNLNGDNWIIRAQIRSQFQE